MTLQFAYIEDLSVCKAVDESLGFEVKTDAALIAKDRGEIIGAFEDGKPVAYLWFCLVWGDTPFINLIRVHSDHQNGGVGTKLYEFFESEMEKKGEDVIISSSEETNERGIAFHTKLGFEEVGYLGLKGSVKEILFEKRL